MGETIEKELNVIFHAGGSSAWVAAVNVSVIVVVVVYVDSKHHFITIIIIISIIVLHNIFRWRPSSWKPSPHYSGA